MQNSVEKTKIRIELPHWVAQLVREKAAERGLTVEEMALQLMREGTESYRSQTP